MLDHLWPSVSPAGLVRDLLTSRTQLATYSKGLLTDDEWPLLLKRGHRQTNAPGRSMICHFSMRLRSSRAAVLGATAMW